jgi:hypothetical protein
LRRCQLRSFKTPLNKLLDILEESVFAIASSLQLTSHFFLATIHIHILAKILKNEGFFLAYTLMIKTFSLWSIPLFAHLNVLVLERADNIVKILEAILKR